MFPAISIVLPVYNGEKYLSESIESIINQNYRNWELIIVNDCSTDNSPWIIEEYAKKDDRISVIHNSVNRRLPHSLNVGFSKARGKYYTWTSDDNMYRKEALEKMYYYMENYASAPMVVASMTMVDTNGVIVGKYGSYNQPEMAYGNKVGACFLYRSEIVDSIGGYDPNRFLVEDYDYWLRILFRYGEIRIIKEDLYIYRLHDGSLSEKKKTQVKEELYKLRTKYLEKLIGLAQLNEDLIIRLYCEMIEMGQLSPEQEQLFMRSCSLLANLKAFDKKKPSIIYGAGRYGKATRKYVSNIAYYSDSNPKLQGKYIEGIGIISVEELCKIAADYQIIVSVHHSKLFRVLTELKDKGIVSVCIVQTIISGVIDYDCFEELSSVSEPKPELSS